MNKVPFDDTHYFESNQKLEDIKNMIDLDSESQKMEGMKRLVALISKGKDGSALFPSVVKNVISKNVELKKLVYMYLVHYAELEPDSVLLAINTFQKDLSASSQWIRASALRVMSSIRVKIIVQLIVLAIQKCVKDTSYYVRKAAAYAIPKVYALDHDQKDELIEIIKVLLTDRSSLVLGSVISAWTEVCPDRFDLIHPHFRKLCHLLADVDEWGQISLLNMLVRYGRTQFEDPNKKKIEEKVERNKKENSNWNNDDESEESEQDDENFRQLDPDHRLLLDCSLPLLKNRNSGVVMGVACLFYYLAPISEAQKIAKPLVRISRSKREIQYVVLTNIATMVSSRPDMFEGAISEFFITPSDPCFSRNIKLEIITYLVNQDNINKILKEFKNYVQMEDKQFVAATIQAIGRCAYSVPEITDRCLHGLMALLTNKSEIVVAETVVVIKQLLQILTGSEDHEAVLKEVISHLAKLLETITVPSARASIIWVIGEYSHRVPLLGPDILRKLAKNFTNEDPNVKLQVLNLGSKLVLNNPEQTLKFFEYVLNLSKYDLNYDVRDRARVMKKCIFSEGKFKEYAKNLFISKKPLPSHITLSEDRQRFLIGTLSHLVNHFVVGYQPLPDWPETPPPSNVRNDQVIESLNNSSKKESRGFWSDEDKSSEDSSSYTSSEDSTSYTSSSEEEEEIKPRKNSTNNKAKQSIPVKKEDPIESLFNLDSATVKPNPNIPKTTSLNIMDELFSSGSISSSPLSVTKPNYSFGLFNSETVKRTLLKSVVGGGLSIDYCYNRVPSMLGANYNTLRLFFKNSSQKPISNIKIGKVTLPEGMDMVPFPEIQSLQPNETIDSQISVKFSSVSNPLKFEISTNQGTFNVSISPNIGDLVRATAISLQEFIEAEKTLKGMNEIFDTITLKDTKNDIPLITQRILDCAYLANIEANFESGNFKFAGLTMIKDELVLFSVIVDKDTGSTKCTLSSENTVLNAILFKQLKSAIIGGS